MHKKTILVAAAMMGFLSQNAIAQQTPPAYCQNHEEFSQWDFWVGDWDVYNSGTDTHVGTNSISKIENGCLLLESWLGDEGSKGQSYNYYDPNTGKWRQLWLSAGGYNIDFSGGLVDGSMVLVGTISYYNQGRIEDFRGTWTPLEDGSVRQFFEQKDQNGEWQSWFDGNYRRKQN